MTKLVLLQISILKNEWLLEKAIQKEFVEAQRLLRDNLTHLYKELEKNKKPQGIKESLGVSEKVSIVLTKSNGDRKTTNI